MYAKKLTKNQLIKDYHIKNIEILQGSTKITVTRKNQIDQVIFLVNLVSGQRVYKGCTLYNYKTKKYNTFGVHRLLYAWFIGNIKAGYVIDHIDNNPNNNSLDNLQMITPKENLAKDQTKLYKVDKIPNRQWFTLEYIDGKLDKYTKRYEEEKKRGDQKALHKTRSLLSQWGAKRRAFLERQNQEEENNDKSK